MTYGLTSRRLNVVKKEWITESNGFTPGCRVLYFDREKPSLNYFLVKLSTAPAVQDELIPYTSRLGVSFYIEEETAYPSKMYCEETGFLYPIDSPLYAYWNPSLDRHAYEMAVVKIERPARDNHHCGVKTVKYYTTYDLIREIHFLKKGYETYIRPAWATK